MRRITISLAGIVILTLAAFLIIRTPDTDPAEMRAKYGGSASRFVDTEGGMSVHYRDQGCRDCPVIILVHGSNSSLHTFEPLVQILKDRYRLISYDQPGHGLTGPHPLDDYSAQGMAEAIDAVVDATGIEQYAIAGNSMGGWVAWRHALERPADLTALILISSSGAPRPPNSEKARLYLGARIMRHPIGRFLAQYITPRHLVEQSLFDSIADEAQVTDEMVDRYWELLRLPGNRRAAGLLGLVDREPEYGQRLNELTLPTLILWGEEDLVVPLYNAETFSDLIPGSHLQVFEGVAHLAMEEVPDRTAAAIDEFLGELYLSPVSAAAEECGSLDAVKWFLADWEASPGGVVIRENWHRVSDVTFEGESITKSAVDDKVVNYETLRLVSMSDGVFYIAKVAEHELPVPFRLARCSEGVAVFENPNHDAPQRLIYRLLEKSAPDAPDLEIRLEGDGMNDFSLFFRSNLPSSGAVPHD